MYVKLGILEISRLIIVFYEYLGNLSTFFCFYKRMTILRSHDRGKRLRISHLLTVQNLTFLMIFSQRFVNMIVCVSCVVEECTGIAEEEEFKQKKTKSRNNVTRILIN